MAPTATLCLTFLVVASYGMQIASSFNLFIERDFGVNVLHWGDVFGKSHLYFIKDDVPYSRTLGNGLLQLIVVQSTHRLQFTWDTDLDEIVTYSWAFTSTDYEVLKRPYLTINHTGVVPKKEGVNPRTEQAGILLNYTVTRNDTIASTLNSNSTSSPNLTIALRLSTRVDCVQLGPIDGKKDESDSKPLWAIGVVFGCLIAIALVLVVTILLYRRWKEKKVVTTLERELTVLRDAQESSSARYMDIYSNSSGSVSGSITYKETLSMRMHNASRKASRPKSDLMSELKEDWFEKLSDCIVEFSQLQIGEELGKGAFGFVYKGMITSADDPSVMETVAVKTMKNVDTVTDMSRFLSEGIVMKDFRHRNVMGLTGVCFPEEDPPIIILPFMANGDLHSFLKKRRGSASSMDTMTDNNLSLDRLMGFINDIARGMDYLSRQNFVHRDLAARNCMLDEDFVVKIGDFGLAKDMHEELYYRLGTPTKLPVKWMAIESLNDQVFTLQTDVWAFGITMWEVLSLGMQPYPGVANHELTELLLKGHRLQKPAICTDDIFEIMSSCWLVDPSSRPRFSELVMMLERVDGDGCYVANVDEPYSYENMSPISKTPSVSYSKEKTVDNKCDRPVSPEGDEYTVMALNSSADDATDVFMTSSQDNGGNYLPMALKSSTLDSANQALNTTPEAEECGDYLAMSLRSPTLSSAKAAIASPEDPDDYMTMTKHSGFIDAQPSIDRRATLPTISSKQNQTDNASDNAHYMEMRVNSEGVDSSIMDNGDGEDYMKMSVKNSRRDVKGASAAGSDYMRMMPNAEVMRNGVVNGEVGHTWDRECDDDGGTDL